MRRAALSAARAARSPGHVVNKSSAEQALGAAMAQQEAALTVARRALHVPAAVWQDGAGRCTTCPLVVGSRASPSGGGLTAAGLAGASARGFERPQFRQFA